MKEYNAKEQYEKGTSYQFDSDQIMLGPWTSYSYMTDPKHMSFVLARYKFCAKMLAGKKSVLEVGCGDGFGLPIVARDVDTVWAVDWDQRLLDNIKTRMSFLTNVKYKHVDFNEETFDGFGDIDGIYAIDVIEHLEPNKEEVFLSNLVSCIKEKKDGVMIIGTPNISAAQYASEQSKVQHINLKSMKTLKETMEKYFYNVFMFGMNDEVIHTGYDALCHYIWAVCAGVK